MNISPFYELRSRLYACAAAGCGTLSEDFRLKRAIEAFEPLSQVNKPFLKLYSDCNKLFSESSPASLLSDCIALADALAVTQGSFFDNCETAPTEMEFPIQSQNIPYSQIGELCDKISSCSSKLLELSENEIKLIPDGRVLSAFIRNVNSNSFYLDGFASYIFAYYGKSAVPMLKTAVDMTDPKATGKPVTYVSNISGKEENDYYISLAKNAEAPQNIRIAAIEALGCDEENSPLLCELYNTEKGKVKTAALNTLLKLDPPEADEIINKLIEKSKSKTGSLEAHISAAKCPSAENFVRQIINETSKIMNSRKPAEKAPVPIEDAIEMMRNKTGIADCFTEVAKLSKKWESNEVYYGYIMARLWDVLIRDYADDPDRYRELIEKLFRSDRKSFFPPYFFMRLTLEPEKAVTDNFFEMHHHREDIARFLCGIKYSPVKNAYVTSCAYKYFPSNKNPRGKELVLFKSVPQNMVKLICDASVKSVAEYHGASDSLCQNLRRFCNNCSEEDRNRFAPDIIETAFKIMRYEPSYSGIELIAENCPEKMARKCRGIVSEYALFQLKEYKRAVYLSIINRLPLSPAEKTDELTSLLNKVSALKGNISETSRNSLVKIIKDEIDSILKG